MVPVFGAPKFRVNKEGLMKLLSLRTCVLGAIVLVLLPSPRSAASSYCSGCAAAVVGAAVAVGAGVGVAIYFVHRSHTSITGCVQQTDNGLSLTAKDGSTYALMNAPSDVKARERFSLRGHKSQAGSARTFRVDHVSRDYGACSE
jgi:hypothetical protein